MPNASNCEHPEIHEQKRSLLDYKGTMSAFFKLASSKALPITKITQLNARISSIRQSTMLYALPPRRLS